MVEEGERKMGPGEVTKYWEEKTKQETGRCALCAT